MENAWCVAFHCNWCYGKIIQEQVLLCLVLFLLLLLQQWCRRDLIHSIGLEWTEKSLPSIKVVLGARARFQLHYISIGQYSFWTGGTNEKKKNTKMCVHNYMPNGRRTAIHRVCIQNAQQQQNTCWAKNSQLLHQTSNRDANETATATTRTFEENMESARIKFIQFEHAEDWAMSTVFNVSNDLLQSNPMHSNCECITFFPQQQQKMVSFFFRPLRGKVKNLKCKFQWTSEIRK